MERPWKELWARYGIPWWKYLLLISPRSVEPVSIRKPTQHVLAFIRHKDWFFFLMFFFLQTTLSFVVLDKGTNAIKMIKEDRGDFMGSCNLSLTEVREKRLRAFRITPHWVLDLRPLKTGRSTVFVQEITIFISTLLQHRYHPYSSRKIWTCCTKWRARVWWRRESFVCLPFSDPSRQSPSLVSAHAWQVLRTSVFWNRSYTCEASAVELVKVNAGS